MLKKTITYTDLNDTARTEDFYFNFTIQELVDMELSVEGGMKAKMEQIVKAENVPAMMGVFKDIILAAVGVKSEDGRRFDKSQQTRDDFYNSPAYGVLFLQMIGEPQAAVTFINGLMPKDLMEKVNALQKEQGLPVTQAPEVRERQPEEYSVQERVEMSEEEFDRIYGTNHKKWSKVTLVAAMRRKTGEEV